MQLMLVTETDGLLSGDGLYYVRVLLASGN